MPFGKETASMSGMMWLIYAYISIYLPKLIYLFLSVIGRGIVRLFKIKKNWGVSIGFVLSTLVFSAMWWGVLVTRNKINIETVEIISDKLPSSFDGYRIVQFSDCHVGTWRNDTTFVSRLVDKINSLSPDLIVFTGDIVSRETAELEPFLSVFKRLNAKDGVYSILGNHDYGDYRLWDKPEDRDENNKQLEVWANEMGWQLMKNSYTSLIRGNDSIVLIGIENWGEPPFHQYGNLRESYNPEGDSKLVNGLTDEKYKILLSHNPEHWSREVVKISNIDLTLSGHTHAMQVMLKLGDIKWSPASLRYKKWGGLYSQESDAGKQYLYVNIGCGEVGLPARYGAAYPEVSEIVLKSGATK